MNSRFNQTGKSTFSNTSGNSFASISGRAAPLPSSTTISRLDRKPPEHANISKINARNIQKKRYEARLSLCHKDLDPLKAWHEYILWLESQYEVDDENSDVKEVVERCVGQYFNDKRYANDKRFYEIFLRYSKQVCDPLEVFSLMHSEGRFTSIADFYINWSWKCEDVSDYEQAERVLQLAIKNQAKPEKLISIARQKLADKLEIATINFKNETVNLGSSLGSANIANNNSHHPVEKSGRLSLKQMTKSEESCNKLSKLAAIASDSRATSIIEKIKMDTNKSDKVTPTTAPVQSVAFQIHVDDPEPIAAKPKADLKLKLAEKPLLSGLISEMKEVVQEDAQEVIKTKKTAPKLFIFEQLASGQRFNADLKRIYVNDTEFSFEEIRYRKMLASKRREAEKQQKEQLCDENAKLKQALMEKEKEAAKSQTALQELEILKKQINLLMEQKIASMPQKRTRDENDGTTFKSDCEKKEKRPKLNSLFQAPLKEQKNGSQYQEMNMVPKNRAQDKELTMVRELFNGSLGNFGECSDDFHGTALPPMKPVKDFSFFKDPTQTNLVPVPGRESLVPGRESLAPGAGLPRDISVNVLNFTTQDAFTIALPQDPSEFRAKYASTPAPSKYR